jgi:2,4-dienoyl-CoA reductase-like NADH-dependent reductase (Old Yellow Enzyme family)
MPSLFDPLALRSVTLAHRLLVSPMCQYSSEHGFSNDWHLVHLGSRAVGGAALVFTEAAAVTPEARISPHDLGIWQDAHVEGLARIVRFIHGEGAVAGIQLAHAGRKGSTARPWEGGRGLGIAQGAGGAETPDHSGWGVIGPTVAPFSVTHPVPRALRLDETATIVNAFRDAARRARGAGFDVVEIHAAHGYLLHQFMSPLINTRTDAYGGSYDNRVRLCLEVVEAVRQVWPDELPMFVRISASDWKTGGWDIEQSVELAKRLQVRGVDLVDCSSGGAVPDAVVPSTPGYQVPFAARVRRDARVPTGAVGLITDARQADAIVRNGDADCVLIARQLLRDPYWAMHAAQEVGHPMPWPPQYLRAAPPGTTRRGQGGSELHRTALKLHGGEPEIHPTAPKPPGGEPRLGAAAEEGAAHAPKR